MSKLVPLNDYFMVEVGTSVPGIPGAVSGINPEDGIREGIVISISDKMVYFGFNTFMFDKSLMDKTILDGIYEHYKNFVGKKVYWPERSETGAIIEHSGKKYAFVKCSAIMAVEEIE